MPGDEEGAKIFQGKADPLSVCGYHAESSEQGELNSLKAAVGIDNLIDRGGKAYRQKNVKYLTRDIEDELL